MKPIERIREKLLAQRRSLFGQVARAEDDLRWLDSNTHPETEEEAQAERGSGDRDAPFRAWAVNLAGGRQ